MTRLLRSSYVIARRDFAATVLSKTFIFFLLGPLFPLLLGALFGSIGARVATQTEQPVVSVVASKAEFARLAAARERLAAASDDALVVRLQWIDVMQRPDARDEADESGPRPRAAMAVFDGGAELIGRIRPDSRTARQLQLIVADASADARRAPRFNVVYRGAGADSLSKDRALTAQIGQMLLFFLTILLSGMVMSQLIEEKSNKIIEVVAAAVPIDALFIGKLFAMLAASVIGIVVWVGAGAMLIDLLKQGGVTTLPPPAVGWPAFLGLGVVYFAMNYLLLGAVFLTIGAQASTAREVQTLSMPVTFAQVLLFGFAALAIGSPNSPEALAAAAFPLSSPMAMLARAAEVPQLWPHLAAIAWQLLWVVLILRLGARLFRKTVLNSGPRTRWWRLRRA